MRVFILMFGIVALFVQCKQEDKTALLFGDWKAVQWTSAGKATDRPTAGVRFRFSPDGRYEAGYGEQSETGVFRLEGDKLYTTADAVQKIEKVVRLSTINADSLVMDMNRTGQPEQLILVKQ